MKLWLNKLKIIIIFSMLLLTAAGCSQHNSKTVKTSENPSPNRSGETQEQVLESINIGYPTSGNDWAGGVLGMAHNQGYLEEYLNPLGYTAKMNAFVGAAPAIHEALISKDLDYVVYAGMAGVIGKANQIDTQLLTITSFTSAWRMVASTGSDIKAVSDLKGKRIAYQRGASPHMYMLHILAEAGIEIEEIEAVNMTIPDALASLSSGDIDAAVISAGHEASLVDAGKAIVIHKGFEAEKNIYYEPTILIGRTEAIQKNPDVGIAIIKALLKAKDKISENVDAYYQLSADKSGNPLEIILETAEDNTDIAFPLSLQKTYIDSLRSIEAFLIDNELIDETIPFEKWINSSLLEKAEKEYMQ